MVLLAAGAAAACAARPSAEAPEPVAYESGPASCPGATSDRRLAQPLIPGAVDAALIDDAIRLHTNAERCRAGIAPVQPDPALAAAAAIQASDMARAGVVAPVVPTDPEKGLERRYAIAGVEGYDQRGENLMQIPLESPGAARVMSAAPECAFGVRPTRALDPTYGSIARRLVDAWMASEAMRANVLAPDWTHMGAAIAIRPIARACGEVYAAQSFKAS